MNLQLTAALAIAGDEVHFINFLFAIWLQFRAENSLLKTMNHNLNYLFVYCTFVSAETSLNAQAIANA